MAEKIDPVIATGVAMVPHDGGVMLLFNRPVFDAPTDPTQTTMQAHPVTSAAVIVTPLVIAKMHEMFGQFLAPKQKEN